MNALEELLTQVFVSHGWQVVSDPSIDLPGEFLLVAENELAISFAALSKPETLPSDNRALSAAIAAFLHGRGGAKAWDAYLLLVVPAINDEFNGHIVQVQRDLTYCRKLVLDASAVLAADHPMAFLEQKLALLFPLRVRESANVVPPRQRLERELADRGTPHAIVVALLDNLDDPTFDAVSYLRRVRES